MERLTKKFEDGSGYGIDLEELYKCVNKLGKIEDIEEELGIEIADVVQGAKNGIWIRAWWSECYPNHIFFASPSEGYTISINIPEKCFDIYENNAINFYESFYFKERGDKWGFTKEEIKNGTVDYGEEQI